ncbi:unnamed protein product [Hermetia illucens]|uniref:H15 domain-containing protein n=1 Tax=Hermetia illucens TaxID=343691 RepID=A0A7R8YVH2_HERIL|nr:histone H1-like [Hermetia illucens]CAD7087307.1 unnamed protein product [Hermetia illucens]
MTKLTKQTKNNKQNYLAISYCNSILSINEKRKYLRPFFQILIICGDTCRIDVQTLSNCRVCVQVFVDRIVGEVFAMAVESAPIAAAGSPKKAKKGAGGPKKPKSKPTHPPTSSMVDAAIKALKERGGSSLPAIKKYLAVNYMVDVEKLAPFIKKYLKGAVASGKLIQPKGTGASGSFKLPAKEKKEKSTKKPAAKKPKAAAKPKKTGEKEAAKPKKIASPKKKAVGAAKAAKKSGSVKAKAPKEKKPKAAKVAKKAPKPKTAAKKAAPKKTAAKK